MTDTCGEPADTSQGLAVCHQPAHDWHADHIAELTNPDGSRWWISWNGNFTNITDAPRGQ